MIVEGIFAQALRRPGKRAVSLNGQAWTYCELTRLIMAARGHFVRIGLAGDGIVALALRNLVEFWILALALRSLGLTTVAIGSEAMLADLDLDDLRAVIAVKGSSVWNGLAVHCAARKLDLIEAAIAEDKPLALDRGPLFGQGGHILLTSGTTGNFKRVLMDPSFEDAFLASRGATLGIDENCVFTLFDFPAWTGAGYKTPACVWTVGGEIVFTQGKPLHEALRVPGATHGIVVPHMLTKILAAPEGTFPRSEAMHLSVSGGAMTRVQAEAAKARITLHLYNRLGATEAGIFGYTRLDTTEDHGWHRIPAERAVEIVDERDRPVAAHVLGRVRVATRDAPSGYFRDPQTSARFFRHGWFYPGDLAVTREDGRFALRGRASDVINLGGTKVSPAPVEERLCDGLGVTGACLVTMQDVAGEEQVHLVLESAGTVATGRIPELLGKDFAGFDRVRIHFVDELPRNRMGKIMRGAVSASLAGQKSGTSVS